MTIAAAGGDINRKELLDQGYTILPGLIDPQLLGEFEREIAQFAQIQCERFGITAENNEAFIDVFQRGGRYSQLLYQMLERLLVLQKMSFSVGEKLNAAEFLSWAGVRTPLLWPDIRVDPPNSNEQLLDMHQDFGSMRCHRAWRLWVPLRPASAYYGSMKVVPGSHRDGFLRHTAGDPSHPRVAADYYKDKEVVTLDLDAGSGVLFNPMLLHESVPNRSDRCKFTLLAQLQDLDVLADPDNPHDPLAPMIALTDQRTKARLAKPARVPEQINSLAANYSLLRERDGLELSFQIRVLDDNDIDELTNLHEEIHAGLSERGILYRRERSHFEQVVRGNGEAIGVTCEGRLVGYSCQRFLLEGEHEAYLPPALAAETGGFTTLGTGSAVHPQKRGFGLLALMIAWRGRRANMLGAQHTLSIVSPGNLPSLAAVLRNDLQIRGIHVDEDGDNFLLHRSLHATAIAVGGTTRKIPVDELVEHKAALAEGLAGWRLCYERGTPRLVFDQMAFV